MYEDFYGLKSKPFQLNPDPHFYFGSKQHRRAKAYLDYGLMRGEGFIVITGEIGAGKTTIVRGLLEGLDADKVIAANLVSTQLDAEDTLRMVGSAFGVPTRNVAKADLLMNLEAFFVHHASQGRRCLLIVDEAQNLSHRAVEELRMLSNFQFDKHALVQSFLVGQPEFREILQHPQMQQLRQRVVATCHIGPINLEETQRYIEHRLKCAGSTGKPEFGDGVFEAIFQASGGVPRRINTVCDRLLLLGFLGGKERLELDDIQEVVREMREEGATGIQSAVGGPSNAQAVASPSSLNRQAAERLDQIAAVRDAERLQRLELSLLRLEHTNVEILALLQRLVGVPEGNEPPVPMPATVQAAD
jgi:putative secretion ATPase (PEP-CTERM system associated)